MWCRYQGFEEGRQFGRSKLTGGQVQQQPSVHRLLSLSAFPAPLSLRHCPLALCVRRSLREIRDDHRKDFDPGRGGYVVHQQQTTFAPLIPGIIRIIPTAARKKQRIDLRAVRANRGERRPRGGGQARQAAAAAAGREKEKVGQKRRRDDEDEDDEQQQPDDDEVEAGGGGTDGEGDVQVDEAEEVATSGEEVATSGAEGDIESAAELDGDTTSVET